MHRIRNSPSTFLTKCSLAQSKYTLFSIYHCRPSHGLYSNSGFLTIFGSRLQDIESILVEERIPDGWESRVRKPYGLTFAAFNFVIIPLELETNRKVKELEAAAQKGNQDQNENQDQNQNQM